MSKKKIIALISIFLVLAVGCVLVFAVLLPHLEAQARAEENALTVQKYREDKFAVYERENAEYADYEIDVAFIGDSLTDGYPVSEFYPQYTCLNRGIGGDTTHTLHPRLSLSLYELKPKCVVMLIGGNNLDTMFENYERILVEIGESLPNTKVVLASLTCMAEDYAVKNPLAAYNNAKIELLAEKHGAYFADLFTPLLDLNTGELGNELRTDAVHLSRAGYEVVTEVLTPVIEGALSEWISPLE